MIAYEEADWDASTETRYEEHRERLAIGLCANEWCDDQALPDDDLCRDCAREFDGEEDEAVSA